MDKVWSLAVLLTLPVAAIALGGNAMQLEAEVKQQVGVLVGAMALGTLSMIGSGLINRYGLHWRLEEVKSDILKLAAMGVLLGAGAVFGVARHVGDYAFTPLVMLFTLALVAGIGVGLTLTAENDAE